MSEDFIKNLRALLSEFRQYQADNNEPYNFDLLRLMEWLDREKNISTLDWIE